MDSEIITIINKFEDSWSKPSISVEEVKSALIEMSVMELSELEIFFYINRVPYPGSKLAGLLLEAAIELQSEMPKADFNEMHCKMFIAAVVSMLKSHIRFHKNSWLLLSNERKSKVASRILSYVKRKYKKILLTDEIEKFRAEKELIVEIMKCAEIYCNMIKEAGIKLKEALRDLNSDGVEAAFDELYDDYDYLAESLLYDALDALYEELPASEYKLILEEKILWLDDFDVSLICKTRHGLANDRKLFATVKRVIDEWDPQSYSGCASDDSYDEISGFIADMLQSTKSNDIGSVAWGIFDKFAEEFSFESKLNSAFPKFFFVVGRLLKAIRDDGLEDICKIKESPFSLQELEDIEADFEKFIGKTANELLDIARNRNFTIEDEDYDSFSAKTYSELQGIYKELS
jgi:hypothetical protein